MIDLHTHTTASDGTLTFGELVKEAERVGLKALAITDHDTVKSAAKIKGKKPGIALIPGIELTVFDHNLGYLDVHILGLFIDPASPRLLETLAGLENQREKQKIETVARIREMGYGITYADVRKKARGVVGRPHIARALIDKHPDEFRSIPEVFDKLLARGRPAYVERSVQFGLSEAVSIIREAGGLSFIAHPHLYPYDPEKLVPDFKGLGGNGLEVHYDYVRNAPSLKLSKKDNDRLIERYHSIASGLGLLESGGSDFHGETKGQRLGEFGAPDGLLRAIDAKRKPL